MEVVVVVGMVVVEMVGGVGGVGGGGGGGRAGGGGGGLFLSSMIQALSLYLNLGRDGITLRSWGSWFHQEVDFHLNEFLNSCILPSTHGCHVWVLTLTKNQKKLLRSVEMLALCYYAPMWKTTPTA